MASPLTTVLTLEDYLARERRSTERHEFRNGVVVQIPRIDDDHQRIRRNITGYLYDQTRKSSFETYINQIRVLIPACGYAIYPDVIVTRDPEYLDVQRDVLLNPIVLVEVLRDVTREYTCELKREQYQKIGSAREVLLVDNKTPTVEHFYRDEVGAWRSSIIRGFDACVRLESIEAWLSLSAIYWTGAKVKPPRAY
jgi:Uma2 family endonuclease